MNAPKEHHLFLVHSKKAAPRPAPRRFFGVAPWLVELLFAEVAAEAAQKEREQQEQKEAKA